MAKHLVALKIGDKIGDTIKGFSDFEVIEADNMFAAAKKYTDKFKSVAATGTYIGEIQDDGSLIVPDYKIFTNGTTVITEPKAKL